MSELKEWLYNHHDSCTPKKEHALRALRHLSHIDRKKLFSPEIPFMRSAEGRWFEMIAYEMFLDIAKETDTIGAVVLKGADAPKYRNHIKLGQNGFYYSKNGDITVRGNGQDLAEFDLLMLKRDGSLVFVEVVTSPSDLKDFLQEIYYKKQLIRYLFGQKGVTFILITSFNLSNYKGGRKILGSEEHISISTKDCTKLKEFITGKWHKKTFRKDLPKNKTIKLTEFVPVTDFDYLKIHEHEKVFALTHILSDDKKELVLPSDSPTAELAKKILFGAVHRSAIKRLSQNYKITVKGEELDYNTIIKRYSKVILAADLPDYTPLLYMRSRVKKEYHKLVFHGPDTFKYERRTPPKVGFFLWLETLEPELGGRVSLRVVEALYEYSLVS